jgi:Protein of unknown function (DUF3179)
MRLRWLLPLCVAAAALAGCLGEEGGVSEPQSLLDSLRGSPPEAQRALNEIFASDDERYAAPLIELLRARELGLGSGISPEAAFGALRRLTGETIAPNWAEWVAWYAGTDLRGPPGFREWKGELFSRIDPDFRRFFHPSHPSRIKVGEIVWGGVRFDGIPALDRPRTVSAAAANYLESDDPVFGVEVNGEARAYPLRILDWHEMVNDVVGRVRVSLAYCTLCGAGVLYHTETPARTYTFGSSGLLMRSNKLMYDRQTHTLWNQLTGEPVLGPLADERIELEVRPIVVTTWSRWRARHPDSSVLDIRTGFDRPYENGAAYADYFSSDEALFPAANPGRGLAPKERLFALRIRNHQKAYPLKAVLRRRVINDRLGRTPLVVIASGDRIYTFGQPAGIDIGFTYDSGAEVRAFARGRHRFSAARRGALEDERGRRWHLTEDALLGPRGERLPRLGGHLAYAFGWLAYFPHTEVYGAARD